MFETLINFSSPFIEKIRFLYYPYFKKNNKGK